MGLDIRFPLGLLFAITGLILVGYGVFTLGSPIYGISGGTNINLFWGGLMLIFGVVMALLGRKR